MLPSTLSSVKGTLLASAKALKADTLIAAMHITDTNFLFMNNPPNAIFLVYILYNNSQ